jgi:Transposase and inactivated derivatives
MKRDGRTLDHATLETIRLMAVERVLEGEVASAVITSYGFNRTTIYKWLTAAAKGVGLQARPAAGRPRRLTPGQEQQVFRWINGKDPRQYGLDFGLWTRSVVADLIARKFGIRLGLTAVGELLAKLNLTPQKPLQRAISAIRRRSSGGGARPIQPLHSKPRRKVARSSSGMSRGFAPMPFTGGPGVSRDTRRSWTVLVSGNQSVPPLR